MISITPLRFFDARLTVDEQLAIASSTDPLVKLFVLKFTMAEHILSTDPRLEQGRQILVSKGLLTPERAAEVFDFS